MKIQQKLFLAFLVGSLVLVTTMYGLMQWSFDQGMIDYVNQRELNSQAALAPVLADQYQRSGNWDFIKGNHRLWRRLLRNSDTGFEERGAPERPPAPHGRHDFDHRPPPPKKPIRIVLLDNNKQPIFGRYDQNQDTPLLPINVDNKTVGWLTLAPRENMAKAYDVAFVNQQQTTYLMISGILLLISACFAYPLASLLTRPIKKLALATHQLASGNYDLQIQHQSNDELGQLTRDFNHLAQTLAANESARKRWIADISHELRTPISITRGELEAMIDGVRPLNQENLHSTHQEIIRLQRIVEDLNELTKADIGALSYQKERVNLNHLIETQIEKFSDQAKVHQIAINSRLPDLDISIWADTTRLSQLLSNLLTNSVKYTDSGGLIQIELRALNSGAQILIEDSSPGVSNQDIDKLFDPLYRAENSRNRETGGSGLGLAICKKIVEGHNGKITVAPSELGGLRFTVYLPNTNA